MSNGVEAFYKIHALGTDRVAQIDEMLTRGLPASQVGLVIQKDWKEWVDELPGSIKKRLERYRRTELRDRIITQVAGATHGMRASTLQSRLNAMEELTTLVGHQKDRFEKMYLKEKPSPLLMKQVTDEGRLLKEMLVELGRLQLETGVLARAPKKVTGTLVDAAGAVQTFEWTEEQQALMEQLEGLEEPAGATA